MNLSAEELKLFDELHNSRKEDLKTFSKEDYKGVWQSIVDKYPETAHFIYELLQNADDAEASNVDIMLFSDKLIFKHNGKKHFNITQTGIKPPGDINAITGIGNSTKKDTSNKIGKFGVGFKSVFQYTKAPEIYDDIFKFKIENYIVPTLLENDHSLRKPGETLFVFHFKEPERAYSDIVDRITNLHNPILFLSNLNKIKICIDGSNKKSYVYTKDIIFSKKYSDDITLQHIILYYLLLKIILQSFCSVQKLIFGIRKKNLITTYM